jgi:hypothetical protein
MKLPRRHVLALALALAASPVWAQQVNGNAIPSITTEPTIDGVINEEVWKDALPISLNYEISPGDNNTPTTATHVRVAHTQVAFLVSFIAEDPNPKEIRAHLRDRDQSYRDDFVGMMMDTFNDQRRAYEFFVNPLGVQMDLIKEEVTGNEDDSWDGLWTSAGRITERGYEVEIRIPFSTLRFNNTDSTRTWGISFFRARPRDKRYQIANQKVSRDANCFLCTFEKYEGFQGAKQGRNLLIVPTVTTTNVETRSPADRKWTGEGVDISPGLDVAWAPTTNLTLNLTVNPDFSQVESDSSQIDLSSNFALYQQEKRPFFLEGADYFNFPFQVLYTRQIANPDAGIRLTGRSGAGTFAGLLARDATTQLLLPGPLGSNFTVMDQKSNVFAGRYRYDFSKELSVGLISTARTGTDYSNVVVGSDFNYQKGPHTFSGEVMRSSSKYPVSLGLPEQEPAGNVYSLGYSFNNRNYGFNTYYTKIDPGFRADLGFIGQVGYEKGLVGGSRAWYRDGKKIHKIRLSGDYDVTYRYDGQMLESEWELNLNFNGPMQSSFGVVPLVRKRYWNGQMFNENYLRLLASFIPGPWLEIGGNVSNGRSIDLAASRIGRATISELWGTAAIGQGWMFNFSVYNQTLRRDGGKAFSASSYDGTLSWQIDPKQRVRLSMQGNQVDREPALYPFPIQRHSRNLAAQLIYSYKVNPRTALFIGGATGGYVSDKQSTLFQDSRGVFMKFSYAWAPEF